MSKINISAILKKHRVHMDAKTDVGKDSRAAMREAIEAVIDKCVEEAKVTTKHGTESHTAKALDVRGAYVRVYPDSILNVKSQINYD